MSAPSLASAGRSRVVAGPRAPARSRILAMLTTVRGLGTAAVTLTVAVALLLPIGALLQIVLMAQVDDRTRTQAIVVLDSGRVWGAPDEVLAARLGHAAELYRAGVAPVVVVTGPARGVERARGVLTAGGVPDEDVISFATGADTVGSLQVIAGVMRDLDWSAATIVTDPAHAARAQATAAVLGIDGHLSPPAAGAGTALSAEYIGRETLALLRFHALTRWSMTAILD